jgi:hypothetical protein
VPFNTPDSTVLKINGHVFRKSGQHWSEERLSLDERWVVLQSWQARPDPPIDRKLLREWGIPLYYTGTAFWDIYNADTGTKVFTIKGTYDTSDPTGDMLQSFWLTERYFIIPLGERRERCLVCEFDAKVETKK